MVDFGCSDGIDEMLRRVGVKSSEGYLASVRGEGAFLSKLVCISSSL